MSASASASALTSPAIVGDLRAVVTIATLPQPGPYRAIWQPALATDAKGALVCVYGFQLTGKQDQGDLWCRRSIDQGATWSEPTPVLLHGPAGSPRPLGYANPVLYRDPAGETLWCFGMRCALHHFDSEFSEVCAAVSADGGLSWRPIELAVLHSGGAYPITCQHIRRVPDTQGARYLLPLHRHPLPPGDGTHDSWLLESRDLLTWRLAGYNPTAADEPSFIHEGGIAAGDDEGELVMAFRTARHRKILEADPTHSAYVTRSRDGGRTWSPARPERALHNTSSKGFFGDDGHGLTIYVGSDGPASQRQGMSYVVRRRGGAWSKPRPFFARGTCGNSYPTLVAMGPGRFAAVWDHGATPGTHRNAIRFGWLEVPADLG